MIGYVRYWLAQPDDPLTIRVASVIAFSVLYLFSVTRVHNSEFLDKLAVMFKYSDFNILLTISYHLRQLYSVPPFRSSSVPPPELLHHPGSAYIF